MGQINALIAGNRGSGKTFFALSVIAQLASLPRVNESKLMGTGTLPTQIFVIDFKNSDLARLAAILPEGRVATDKVGAIKLVENFDKLMHGRLVEIKKASFGATAATLGMPLYYLIIDEWSATNSSFMQGLTKEDKDLRYRWSSLITDISMLGRLPGFGIIIISQQISVGNSGVSTALQEEVGLKVHFGDAEMATYHLTFGNEVKIPEMHLQKAEGFAWLEGVTSIGYVIPFAAPFIDTSSIWDILQQALKNQDSKKYLDMKLNDS